MRGVLFISVFRWVLVLLSGLFALCHLFRPSLGVFPLGLNALLDKATRILFLGPTCDVGLIDGVVSHICPSLKRCVTDIMRLLLLILPL